MYYIKYRYRLSIIISRERIKQTWTFINTATAKDDVKCEIHFDTLAFSSIIIPYALSIKTVVT